MTLTGTVSTLTNLRSLEDTMNIVTRVSLAIDVNGNSSRYYANQNASALCPRVEDLESCQLNLRV